MSDISGIHARRSHTKSRYGCTACKKRHIKCDEIGPSCSACVRRKTPCSLMYAVGDSNRNKTGTVRLHSNLRPAPCNIISPLVAEQSLIRTLLSLSGSQWDFGAVEHELLHHYVNTTSNTIGGSNTQKICKELVPQLAMRHTYLMHGILALSLLHTENLKGRIVPSKSLTRRLNNHWHFCISEYITALNSSLHGETGDAVLVTSSLINGLAFVMVETDDFRIMWPNKSSENGIRWLSIQNGLLLVSQSVQSAGETSAIRRLFADWGEDAVQPSVTHPKPWKYTSQVTELCRFLNADNPEGPYHRTLQFILPLIGVECRSNNVFKHLGFITAPDERFVELLRHRDHKALLLLSYWCANMCSSECWWILARVKLECLAICAYLYKHGDDSVRSLLQFPADMCNFPDVSADESPAMVEEYWSPPLIPCTSM